MKHLPFRSEEEVRVPAYMSHQKLSLFGVSKVPNRNNCKMVLYTLYINYKMHPTLISDVKVLA